VYVEVHHIDGIQWEKLIDLVYEMLLCDPKDLITVCEDCHKNMVDKAEK
jgi:predicted HNH restriction endonuclease